MNDRAYDAQEIGRLANCAHRAIRAVRVDLSSRDRAYRITVFIPMSRANLIIEVKNAVERQLEAIRQVGISHDVVVTTRVPS